MASTQFRKVALIAATGNLGGKILDSLQKAGFDVTAVQRQGSSNTVASGIKSVQADLKNKDDLIKAFKGHDVVVSAIPNPVLEQEKIMIDAAIAAGIKRIVPSEFSSNLEAKAKQVNLAIVRDKLRIREYVEKIAASGDIEYTTINNGPFFDMGIQIGFLGPNVGRGTTTYHDGGDKMVCTTSTDDIADAVAKALLHPAETRNKPVYVYSAAVTEKQITSVVEKITGKQLQVEHRDVQADAQRFFDAEKNGEEMDMMTRFSLYLLMMYGPGYGGDYRDMAMNEKIGLRVMNDQEIEESIRKWLPKD